MQLQQNGEPILTTCSVIALSKLYALNDPRIAQTQVKGDLIVPTSDRIMTRSRAKQSTPLVQSPLAMNPITDFFTPPPKDPDQYTVVPAPLKILKVLIEELLSAQGKLGSAAANAAAAVGAEFEAGEDDGDGSWEDEGDTIDLNLGTTKNDLMSYLEASNMRERDDETQAYLTEFFLRAAREDIAGFKGWYDQLTDDEKAKLNELATQ